MTQLSSPPPAGGDSVRPGGLVKLIQSIRQPDPLMALGGILVAMVIVGAFVVSFEVLRDLARSYGIPGSVDWFWPVIVDGTIAAATVVLYAGRNLDQHAKLLPIFTLILFVLVSVAGNVMHNLLTDNVEVFTAWFMVIRVFVSAVPPVGLILSVELFITLIRIREARSEGAAESVEIPSDAENVNVAPVACPNASTAAVVTPVQVAPVTAVTAAPDPPVTALTEVDQAPSHQVTFAPSKPVIEEPLESPMIAAVKSPDPVIDTSAAAPGGAVAVAEIAPAADEVLPQLPEPMTVAPALHAIESIPLEPGAQVEWIVARARAGRDISKRTLREMFEEAGQPVSDSTAQRRLREARQKAPEVFAA